MSSSPAEQALHSIIAGYQQALAALASEQLDRLGALLDDVDRSLPLVGGIANDAEQILLAQAMALHRELCARVADARAALAPVLDHVRNGKRALQGYGQSSRQTGERLDRDA